MLIFLKTSLCISFIETNSVLIIFLLSPKPEQNRKPDICIRVLILWALRVSLEGDVAKSVKSNYSFCH